VARGSDAYFKYVNSRGGVRGRKIVYKYLDDGYDPARTVQLTQRLVEQDQVFALFDTVGTDNALAIRQYVNDRKVPDLFVGSGAAKIAIEHGRYPWMMGYLPSFVGEGLVDGRRVAHTTPRAKVAVLYENSDFGKDMLAGLRRGLAGKSKIVSQLAYETTDTDVGARSRECAPRTRTR
jgi:branched-chain amino acid transport system substrate-binding protein